MKNKFIKGLSAKEMMIILVILISGIVYVLFIYEHTIRQEKENVMQIARSVEVSLPKGEIQSLPENPEELQTKDFSQLKKTLQQIILVNKDARFAYLYLQRSNKLYFIVDSEPESSPDYSPAGQEFTEAEPIDSKPFQDGKALITNQVTDRWGTWVSAEVPIFDDTTGKVIAVFGMDYEAKSWRNRIFFEVAESSLLVVIILILTLAVMLWQRRNAQLRREISLREIAEKGLKESESEYRLLFELNPQPMLVYDMGTMMILAVNQATIDKYGYSKDEFLQMSILDLKSSDKFVKLWKNLIEDKHSLHRLEVWNHKLKDGSTIQVEVHSHNFDFRNKDARLILLLDITANNLAEEKLRQSEANLARTIEESPFGIRILSGDGTTLYANPALLGIFGFDSLNDFNQIPVSSWYTPECYQEYLAREASRKNGEDVKLDYEVRIISKKLGIRHLLVHRQQMLWNGEINNQLIYQDITARKIAENQLIKLSSAIKQNPVSVVITNFEGLIEYVNPRFTEMTGYILEEVLGKNPRILKSGKMDPTIFTDLWNTIISGKIWQGELINRKKSGEFYWDLKSISPIFDSNNQITNFVATAEDITEKKQKEAELIYAKEKAQESDRLKSAFLANISHEIRTPMNGIMGFAELLKEPDLSSENQHEFIGVIEQSGQRMLNIINDLIDISKIEAGETILRIRETNVNKMLRELQLFFMPEVNQKNIYLDYHCDLADDESIIETDITKLNQILTNLIKNAVKFTDKGSISFGYKHKAKMLEFYITDTGPGIPQEQKDLIFERFRQGSQSLNKVHEGAGLGLAISKAYVELLGGSIWIESQFGQGSTFSFDTPIRHQPQ